MKNTIFKLIEYVYYFSLLVLLILYLFPGSLIGIFYMQLRPTTKFNHQSNWDIYKSFSFFSYITILAMTED